MMSVISVKKWVIEDRMKIENEIVKLVWIQTK